MLTTYFGFGANAQSYDAMWKNVQQAYMDDLPKEIIKYTNDILKKAEKEGNFAQEMKAWVALTKAKMEQNPDSVPTITPPKYEKVKANEAVVNAIMGTGVEWLDQGTKEERKEFFRKVLQNKEQLYNTKVDDYLPILEKGEDSYLYGNDMLSVLTYFIKRQQSFTYEERIAIIKDVSEFYKAKGNLNAYALLKMDMLNEMYNHIPLSSDVKRERNIEELKALLEECKDVEVGADVAYEYYQEWSTLDKYTNAQRLEFLRWAQRQFPKNKTNFVLKEKQLLRPLCNIRLGESSSRTNIFANRPIPVKFSYSNIDKVTMEVRKDIGRDEKGNQRTDGKLFISRTYTEEFEKSEVSTDVINKGEFTDSITLAPGKYLVIAKGVGTQDIEQLHVTNLGVMILGNSVPANKKMYSAVVFDKFTGMPVKGATIKGRKGSAKEFSTYTTDENGEVDFELDVSDRYSSWVFFANHGEDDQSTSLSLRNLSSRTVKNDEETIREVYFDRPIYRPGQTVHIAVISFNKSTNKDRLDDKIYVNENDDVQIDISDADNNKKFSEILTTNQFGSASIEFTIPKDAKPGQWRVDCEGKYAKWIRVEEYKRPNFYIVCENSEREKNEPKKKSTSFGDTISVVMKALNYSGVPVQGAKVEYVIKTGSERMGRRIYSWNDKAKGELVTDNKGRVTIPMYLDSINHEEYDDNYFVSFRVECKITDQAGETHEEYYVSSVSKKAFVIQPYNLYGTIDIAGDYDVGAKAVNADYKEIDPDELFYPQWKITTKDRVIVASGSWVLGKSIAIPDNMKSGSYSLCYSAKDKNGNEIEETTNITIFNSEKIGEETCFDEMFLYSPKHEFSEKEPAVVYFSPCNDATSFVYLYITAADNVIEKRRFKADRKLYKLEFPYKKEYVGGICVRIFYTREGVTYGNSSSYTYVKPDTELKLTWKTFRDKLSPGQKEDWILNVKDKKGNNIAGAEMLATLYDASLEQIAGRNYWSLPTNLARWVPNFTSFRSSLSSNVYLSLTKHINLSFERRDFTALTTYFGYAGNPLSISRMRNMRGLAKSGMVMSAVAGPAMADGMAVTEEMEEAPVLESKKMLSFGLAEANDEQALQGRIAGLEVVENEDNAGSPEIHIRENFAETAFFYPNLISNKDGEVEISFTLPESLTEWRFMGLVHTKDMLNNSISATCVARKEFMVQPNMPRFIREGDKATIVSRIINQSEKNIEGKAQIRLIDSKTDKVVLSQELPFKVDADNTSSVEFTIEDLKYYEEPLICEITANSQDFSDGERNYLPVLSSKIFLTETVPFFLEQEMEKAVNLSDLFNYNSLTATDKTLSLSYTSNPATLVIDALEAMKVVEDESAPSYAAALYANTMLRRIYREVKDLDPSLLGQKQGQNSDSNAEISIDSLTRYIVFATDKLRKLQNSDGSWSWFEGMDGSYYITLAVCENLALLGDSLSSTAKNMLESGLDFLDKEELKYYRELKKMKDPSYNPSESTLHYLHVYTLIPSRKMNKELTAMTKKYLDVFQKQSRELTIYGKADGANILRYFGYEKRADVFIKSIMEYSTYKKGMGRYFDTRKAYYSWRDYKVPTQIAAMKAIKTKLNEFQSTAIGDSELADSLKTSLNEMMIWLFRQKQVQKWDSPMNTVGVADFIIKDYASELTVKVPTTFTLDGKEIQIDDTLEITQPISELKVVKNPSPDQSQETGPAPLITWGAVTGTFYETVDNVKSYSTEGFKVETKILGENFKVGDKVTYQITVEADRDMDFVKVTCQQPACFEPVKQTSGYSWMGGSGCYISRYDNRTELFYNSFRKGKHVIELEFYVTREGTYQCGLSTVKCNYCPDFQAHSASQTIKVSEK